MALGLEFGHVIETLGTFVNKVAGLFGSKGGEGEEAGEVIDSESWSHYGFDSRPHPADEKGRCEVIFSRDEDVTICTKDRRYRINLKDGEVALYSGEDGSVKCKHVLKPDGTVMMTGTNLGVLISKNGDGSGDVTLGAANSLTLARTEGTTSLITLDKNGGVKAVTSGGSHMTLDADGKAVLAVDGASVILDGKKAIINATEISISGTAGVGISPVQLPVAVVGCMAGPFPIANGSMALKAQFP